MLKIRNSILATLFLTSSVLGAADTATAQSSPSNEELAKRMEALQMQLDALIKLQTKNAETASSPDASSAAPAAASQVKTANTAAPVTSSNGYRKGLMLDLYVEPNVNTSDLAKLLPIPKDLYPSASALVAPKARFEWAAFTEIDQMKRFAEPMKTRIALNWSGNINIPTSGPQVFALEVGVDRGSRTTSCISSLMIDNHEVVRVTSVEHYGDQRLSSNQGSISLAAGYHEFSLFGFCNGEYSQPEFERVHFNLLTKGPTDRAPAPIPADRFVTTG